MYRLRSKNLLLKLLLLNKLSLSYFKDPIFFLDFLDKFLFTATLDLYLEITSELILSELLVLVIPDLYLDNIVSAGVIFLTFFTTLSFLLKYISSFS